MKLYNFISIAADTVPRPDCKVSAQPCALAGCLAGGLQALLSVAVFHQVQSKAWEPNVCSWRDSGKLV